VVRAGETEGATCGPGGPDRVRRRAPRGRAAAAHALGPADRAGGVRAASSRGSTPGARGGGVAPPAACAVTVAGAGEGGVAGGGGLLGPRRRRPRPAVLPPAQGARPGRPPA